MLMSICFLVYVSIHYGSRRPEMFYKKAVLKTVRKSTGKHLRLFAFYNHVLLDIINATDFFLYFLKVSENQRFSDVFRV